MHQFAQERTTMAIAATADAGDGPDAALGRGSISTKPKQEIGHAYE